MSPDQIVCICGTTHLDYDGPQVACPKHGIDVETVRWLHANGLCPVQTPAEAVEWVDRSNNPRTWRDTDGEGFLWDEQPDGRIKLRPYPGMNPNLVKMFAEVDQDPTMGHLVEVRTSAKGDNR